MTNPYHVRMTPTAQKHIRTLDVKLQKLVIRLIEALAINPRPPGAEKIDGMTGLYSETVSPLRVIYKIEDQEILILLVK